MDEGRFAPVARLLARAVERRVCPALAFETGTRARVLWRHAAGRLTYEPDAVAASLDTVYDLASLTKAIATTSLCMRLVDRGRLALDELVRACLPAWRGTDRETVTVADLLEHAGGLTAHLPFFRDHRGRAEFEHAICTLPLEYVPRTRSIYSDLGFMLLAFIVADTGEAPLDDQWDRLAADLDLTDLRFRPPAAWRPRIAPTEVDPWRGRLLQGEVHDENGWALGGVAGHTGLFGTAGAVGRFARTVLRTTRGDTALARRTTLSRFLRRSAVPGSSRALGWDTMRPSSSCGHRLSTAALGHTGFTGTSLWIDPERDLYVVLLTNRIHPTRQNEAILDLRPAVHDAVVDAIGDGPER